MKQYSSIFTTFYYLISSMYQRHAQPKLTPVIKLTLGIDVHSARISSKGICPLTRSHQQERAEPWESKAQYIKSIAWYHNNPLSFMQCITTSIAVHFIWLLVAVAPQDLSGKVIIVTGANVGIGYETTKAVASMKPEKIIMACRYYPSAFYTCTLTFSFCTTSLCITSTSWSCNRSVAKAETAKTEIQNATGFKNIEVWELDLASFASVKAFSIFLHIVRQKPNHTTRNAFDSLSKEI